MKNKGPNNPLAGRPGLVVESAEVNALAKDLGQLAKRHGLRGCVLISFTDERVGVNSSGEPDRFGRAMEQLGDRLLAAIDDGKFDPYTMTLQRFQGIVLRLGNQMFVRHYLWLNYPNDPQLMGIELIGQAPNGKKRKATCECGTCQKCLHREYMRGYRPSGRLATELESEGFRFNEETGIWTVERDDTRTADSTVLNHSEIRRENE